MNAISGAYSQILPAIGLNSQNPAARAGKLVQGGESFDSIYNMGVNSLKSSVSEPFKTSSASSLGSGDSMPSSPGIGSLIKAVDKKTKAAAQMRAEVLSGNNNSIHRAMIASQEAGVSFSLLVEMRNKLLETYQELMRLQV